jgi:hypothetical protein
MPDIQTVREKIAWGYANLAAFEVLLKGAKKPAHFMVRAKLFRGLCDDTMKVATLYKDERSKMLNLARCSYCGDENAKTADHLLPRIEGGSDVSSNLVVACRSCNSSKGRKDVFAWFREKGQFPPIRVMQRYMKLAWEYHISNGEIEKTWEVVNAVSPFRLDLLPHSLPTIEDVALSSIDFEEVE